jgi:hypothetical protein
MKVISFDIGIKNMAYCVLSSTDNHDKPIIIHDWNVLSMVETNNSITYPCNCSIPGKNKKTPSKLCGKKSKYQKDEQYFCERHAKKNTQWIIPTKQHSINYIKKQKVQDIITICNTHMLLIKHDVKTLKKDKLVEILLEFYQQRCYDPIITPKKVNANDVDLICIGKSIKHIFNQLPDIETITHVLIENQISPIANRMKTIQGMLAQYFIMKNDNIHIEFVSSSHKLRQFKDISGIVPTPIQNTITDIDKTVKNPNYKSHKNDGILYTNQILCKNDDFNKWSSAMNTPKKDDLADAFLQGLWYFKNQNIILYADDLNIKLV